MTPFIGNRTGNFLVQVIVTDYCAVIKKCTSCLAKLIWPIWFNRSNNYSSYI